MPDTEDAAAPLELSPRRLHLSLDWWAVLTSLSLSALVLSGLIRSVPW